MPGLLSALRRVDSNVIYILVALSMLIPLIKPFGIPILITQDTREWANFIDSLKRGDTVLLSSDYGASQMLEMLPQMTATVVQCAKKGINIILIGFSTEGPSFHSKLIETAARFGAKYGENVVDLGYVSGVEMGISSVLTDFARTVPTDTRGTPLGSLPLTQTVKKASGLAAAAMYSAGTPGPEEWVRQTQTHKIPLLLGLNSAQYAKGKPFVQAKQAKACLGGQIMAAEYELLLGVPGTAMGMTDAASGAYILFVILIGLGNLIMYLEKGRAASKKGG